MNLLMFLSLFFFTAQMDLWDYNLLTHSDITWRERNEEYLNKYVGEYVAKRHPSLIFHTSTAVPKNEVKWSFAFQSKNLLTPEEARIFITKVHKDLIIEIQKNKDTVGFLTQDLDARTIPTNMIACKITFYNKDRTAASPPHVARVFYNLGKIYYNLYDGVYNELGEPIALN